MHVYLTNLCGSATERLPIYAKENVEVLNIHVMIFTSSLAMLLNIISPVVEPT